MANFIGTQAGKIVDKTKLRMTIANHEAIVENLYKKLGKHYYKMYRQGEAIDDPMIEVCKLIESNLKTIKAMKEDMEKGDEKESE